MPTIEYKRLWCKKCTDWELFEQQYPNWTDWFCRECETAHENVLLSEIPEEKILEQRKRYIEWNKKSTNEFLTEFMTPNVRALKEFMHMMSPPGTDIEIRESDAGQHAIDDERRRYKEEERQKKAEEKEKIKQHLLKYRGLNRNDKCVCGSGKKYKKCCLPGNAELIMKYRF
jgi:uncharacterized protein YchJ